MLSTVHTYAPIYYAPFAPQECPLLAERDPRDGYWNIDTKKWDDLKKGGAAYWIKFTYDHKRGDITFTLLYDISERQAIVQIGPETYWDQPTRAQWRYNAKYIPRSKHSHPESSEPTLRQTLCNMGFTDTEIAELRFSYNVDDIIDLTYNEKAKQENQDEEPDVEDYDY